MDTTSISFDLANIVLLYGNLGAARISRDPLFNLYADEKPQHIDVGPLLAVRYVSHRIEAYLFFEENRVETKVTTPTENDWSELARQARKVYDAVSEVQIKAFGFNYFVSIPMSENQDANQFLVKQFDASLNPLSKELSGEVFSFAPVIRYTKDKILHQLILGEKPGNPKLLSIQLNVHYQTSEFPAEAELAKLFAEQKENFVVTIGRLFN